MCYLKTINIGMKYLITVFIDFDDFPHLPAKAHKGPQRTRVCSSAYMNEMPSQESRMGEKRWMVLITKINGGYDTIHMHYQLYSM